MSVPLAGKGSRMWAVGHWVYPAFTSSTRTACPTGKGPGTRSAPGTFLCSRFKSKQALQCLGSDIRTSGMDTSPTLETCIWGKWPWIDIADLLLSLANLMTPMLPSLGHSWIGEVQPSHQREGFLVPDIEVLLKWGGMPLHHCPVLPPA